MYALTILAPPLLLPPLLLLLSSSSTLLLSLTTPLLSPFFSPLSSQMRAENKPVPELKTSDGTDPPPQQNQPSSRLPGAGFLKFLKPTFAAAFGKPKLQEIHSANITDEERQKTLAPFELSGVSQVGRDYEAFLRNESAWGSHPQPETEGKKAGEFPGKPSRQSQPDRNKEPPTETKEKVAAAKQSPLMQRKHRKLPLLPPSNAPLMSPPDSSPSSAARSHSPLQVNKLPFHEPLAKKPSAPSPAPSLTSTRDYRRLTLLIRHSYLGEDQRVSGNRGEGGVEGEGRGGRMRA